MHFSSDSKLLLFVFHPLKMCFYFSQENQSTKKLTHLLFIFITEPPSPLPPPPLLAEKRQHPLRLGRRPRGEGGAHRGGGGAVGRPVAHAAAGQERLGHLDAGGWRLPPRDPARHAGLRRPRRFNLLPGGNPTWPRSAENSSRWEWTIGRWLIWCTHKD